MLNTSGANYKIIYICIYIYQHLHTRRMRLLVNFLTGLNSKFFSYRSVVISRLKSTVFPTILPIIGERIIWVKSISAMWYAKSLARTIWIRVTVPISYDDIHYSSSTYIFFFIIQRVKARAIPCPHQLPTRGDNTVSEVPGGTATPGATKQLLPLDRVFKRIIYIYIYARSIKSRDYIGLSSSFLVCSLWFLKNAFTFGRWCYYTFMTLRNHTGMVIPHAFHSC